MDNTCDRPDQCSGDSSPAPKPVDQFSPLDRQTDIQTPHQLKQRIEQLQWVSALAASLISLSSFLSYLQEYLRMSRGLYALLKGFSLTSPSWRSAAAVVELFTLHSSLVPLADITNNLMSENTSRWSRRAALHYSWSHFYKSLNRANAMGYWCCWGVISQSDTPASWLH